MTRAKSIANALTADQARMAVADFLGSVERFDEHQQAQLLAYDLKGAVRSCERMAEISEEWQRHTDRVVKCARCRTASVRKAGRICSGCRKPVEAAV